MKKVLLNKVMEAIGSLPEFNVIPRKIPEFSQPMLKEIEGNLYIVYMGYFYGEHIPDRYYLYNTETEMAESLSNPEAMERFGLDSLEAEVPELPEDEPVEWPDTSPEETEEEAVAEDLPYLDITRDLSSELHLSDTEVPEEEEDDDWDEDEDIGVSLVDIELEELFARALDDESGNGEAKRKYMIKLMHTLPVNERGYYWTFA